MRDPCYLPARQVDIGCSISGRAEPEGRVITVSMPRGSSVIAFVLAVTAALFVAATATAGNGRGVGPNEAAPPNTDVKVKEPKGKRNWPGIAEAAAPATAVSAATATTPLNTV